MLKRLLLATTAFVLVACSGSDSKKEDPSRFVVDTRHVTFTHLIGDEETPRASNVYGDIKNASGNYFIEIEVNDSGVIDTERTRISQQSLIIFPGDPIALGPGEHTDQILVKACRDKACTTQIKGSPIAIQVAFDVSLPRFEASGEMEPLYTDLKGKQEPSKFDVFAQFSVSESKISLSNSISDDLFDFDIPLHTANYEGHKVSFDIFLNDVSNLEPGKNTVNIDIEYDLHGFILSDSRKVDVYKPTTTLSVPKNGVFLTSTPKHQNLSLDLPILSSVQGDVLTWQATTEQDWLTITPEGSTDEQINISANVEGLAKDQLHTAQVLVSGPDQSSQTEVITVGLWVTDKVIDSFISLPEDVNLLAVNSTRPHVYVVPEQDNEQEAFPISIYNYLTGQSLGVISVMTKPITSMKVNGDGSVLYVSYEGVSESGDNITKFNGIDLTSGQVIVTWDAYDPHIENPWSHVIVEQVLRINGEEIVRYAPNSYFSVSKQAKLKLEPQPSVQYDARITESSTHYCAYVICGSVQYSSSAQKLFLSDGSLIDGNDNLGYGTLRSTTSLVGNRAVFVSGAEIVISDLEDNSLLASYPIDGDSFRLQPIQSGNVYFVNFPRSNRSNTAIHQISASNALSSRFISEIQNLPSDQSSYYLATSAGEQVMFFAVGEKLYIVENPFNQE